VPTASVRKPTLRSTEHDRPASVRYDADASWRAWDHRVLVRARAAGKDGTCRWRRSVPARCCRSGSIDFNPGSSARTRRARSISAGTPEPSRASFQPLGRTRVAALPYSRESCTSSAPGSIPRSRPSCCRGLSPWCSRSCRCLRRHAAAASRRCSSGGCHELLLSMMLGANTRHWRVRAVNSAVSQWRGPERRAGLRTDWPRAPRARR
jgi:hypothetical protein